MADIIAAIEETAQLMRDQHRMQCTLCLQGAIHEVDLLCATTHTPWKNCGEECCLDSNQI